MKPKIKLYRIAKAGSTDIGTIYATCITKACKQFVGQLDRPAKYELYDGRQMASVRYLDNYCVCGDFVIIEA